MTISMNLISWLEEKRKIFHVLPSIMIDYRKMIFSKRTTLIFTWLFWSIGISFRTDD